MTTHLRNLLATLTRALQSAGDAADGFLNRVTDLGGEE